MLVMFVSILGYAISMLSCICRLEVHLHLGPLFERYQNRIGIPSLCVRYGWIVLQRVGLA